MAGFNPSETRITSGSGGGQWTVGGARNAAAAQAQKSNTAHQLYNQLLSLPPAKRAAFVKGLSSPQLEALSKMVYSFASSNANLVNARAVVANELGHRGLDVKKYGALGGGISSGGAKAAAAKKAAPKKAAGSQQKAAPKKAAGSQQKAAPKKAAGSQQKAAPKKAAGSQQKAVPKKAAPKKAAPNAQQKASAAAAKKIQAEQKKEASLDRRQQTLHTQMEKLRQSTRKRLGTMDAQERKAETAAQSPKAKTAAAAKQRLQALDARETQVRTTAAARAAKITAQERQVAAMQAAMRRALSGK